MERALTEGQGGAQRYARRSPLWPTRRRKPTQFTQVRPGALGPCRKQDGSGGARSSSKSWHGRPRKARQPIGEVAEAAKHLGALAYLHDTRKAIEAYQTATRLDPDDASSWIFLGRSYLQAGNLASAQLALEQALEAADRTGNEREQGLAQLRIGDLRISQGDLSAALGAYTAHAIAEKLVARA